MSQADAIAFVHMINKDEELQAMVRELGKGRWRAFSALALEYGLDFDYQDFMNGCLSPEVNYFCPALIDFAGQLYLYKM